jgi:hypothetical protein
MKRKQLKQCLDDIHAEMQVFPYEHWENARFPIVLRRKCQGQEVMVEMDILSKKPDILEVLISVYACDLFSPYLPVGMNLVVRKRNDASQGGRHSDGG